MLGRFVRQPVAVGALCVLVALVLLAFAGSPLWKYGYSDITSERLAGPSTAHPFGTDALGHDVLGQAIRAAQRSIGIALIVAVVSTVIGAVAGLAAGFFRGRVDTAIMRLVDLLLTLPLLAVLGVLAVRFGGDPNAWLLIAFVTALMFWTPTARVIRGVTLSLREESFVDSARLVGASPLRILLRHLLPHVTGPVSVIMTTTVAAAVSLESTLSFLGLGVQPPDVSLGVLVQNGSPHLQNAPWLFFIPSLMIVLLVLAAHLVGDGLRRAMDVSQSVGPAA